MPPATSDISGDTTLHDKFRRNVAVDHVAQAKLPSNTPKIRKFLHTRFQKLKIMQNAICCMNKNDSLIANDM